MKKLLLTLLFAVILAAFCAFTSSAATEIEYNNDPASATPISVNAEISGNISSHRDYDYYVFTVPASGYVTVDFSHEFLSHIIPYWDIFLLQDDGVTGVCGFSSYWRIGSNEKFTSWQVGLAPGTYYALVKNANSCDATYTLCVNFTESSTSEVEPNQKPVSATPIGVNTDYTGAIIDWDDYDYYKLDLTTAGYVTVDFSHEFLSHIIPYWDIFLLQDDGVTGVCGFSSYWRIGSNEKFTSSQIGLAPGTYYVLVKNANSCDVAYTLRVNFTESTTAEAEPNQKPASATPMNVNTDYTGALIDSDDRDYYRFELKTTADITINFNHEMIDSSSGYWRLYLLSSDGVTELHDTTAKGNSNAKLELGEMAAGTYYILVEPYNYDGSTYTLNVSEKHDCSGEFATIQAPTCTEDGTEEKRCTVCSRVLDSKVLPATGHAFEINSVDVAATCTSEGQQTVTCTACGLVETQIVAPLPHNLGEWTVISGNMLIPPIVKEATCADCGFVDKVSDWSHIWITILVALALIGIVTIIVLREIKFRKKHNELNKKILSDYGSADNDSADDDN